MGLRVDLPFRATSSRQDASSCRVTPRQWTTTRLPIATTQRLFDMDEPASSAIPPAAPPPTQVGEIIAADVLSSPASPSTQFPPSDFFFASSKLQEEKSGSPMRPMSPHEVAGQLYWLSAQLSLCVAPQPSPPTCTNPQLTPSAPPFKGHSFSRPCSYDRPYRGRKIMPPPPAPGLWTFLPKLHRASSRCPR